MNSDGSTEALEHISDLGAPCHFLHKVVTMVVMVMMMMRMLAMMTRMMMMMIPTMMIIVMVMMLCRMTPQWQLCPSALAEMCTA